MAGLLTIHSCRIPGDAVSGCVIEPYVIVRRPDQANLDAKDCAEEGSGDARYCLRWRWYRSSLNKGGAVCFFHQVEPHSQIQSPAPQNYSPAQLLDDFISTCSDHPAHQAHVVPLTLPSCPFCTCVHDF